MEVELQHPLTWYADDGEPEPEYATPLAEHPSGINVVVEHRRFWEVADEDGEDLVYATVEEAERAGHRMDDLSEVRYVIPEAVTAPAGVLPGERRAPAAQVRRALEATRAALARAALLGSDVPLRAVLRPQDGWRLSPEGEAALVGPHLAHGNNRAHTQFTVGVPVNGLLQVLQLAHQHVAVVEPGIRDLFTAGNRFAERVTAHFAGRRSGPSTSRILPPCRGWLKCTAMPGCSSRTSPPSPCGGASSSERS
jgi:hypothetical protein